MPTDVPPEKQISEVIDIIKEHFPDFIIYWPGKFPLWSGAETYSVGDIVEFDSVSYICKNDQPGHKPLNKDKKVNSKYWEFYATPNKHIIDALILYFCKNPAFEKIEWIKNPSLDKGLRFSGNVGTGKSAMLTLFSNLSRGIKGWDKFGVFNCRKIVRQYRENEVIIELNGTRSYTKHWKEDFKRPTTRAFDGFGEEIQRGPVNIYGNKVNVLQEILMDRYDAFLDDSMITHITTNLILDEVRELYSTMLADRFKEMFNNIVFKGQSMRK